MSIKKKQALKFCGKLTDACSKFIHINEKLLSVAKFRKEKDTYKATKE